MIREKENGKFNGFSSSRPQLERVYLNISDHIFQFWLTDWLTDVFSSLVFLLACRFGGVFFTTLCIVDCHIISCNTLYNYIGSATCRFHAENEKSKARRRARNEKRKWDRTAWQGFSVWIVHLDVMSRQDEIAMERLFPYLRIHCRLCSVWLPHRTTFQLSEVWAILFQLVLRPLRHFGPGPNGDAHSSCIV